MPNRFTTFLKLHKISLLLVLIGVLCYYTFAHHLLRTDFPKLIALFATLFVVFYKLIQFEKWNYRFLLFTGILFRIVFLFAAPNLSQDFYRFVWDGQLIINSINPYLYIPDDLIQYPNLGIPNAITLHEGMGALSARHYSNYPPLNQLLFSIAALLGGKSILGALVAMRVMIIMADMGIFYFGRKLLKNLNQSPQMIFWYFLNPLIIIELTGNLHFEGVMLFFFILSMYLLSIKKWQLAAIALGSSIAIKLVPLLFLPLFIKYFGWKKSVAFYLLVGITGIAVFIQFYTPEFFNHYAQTLRLWFTNFEFNAGLYSVVKGIAVQFDAKPWEFIKEYGKITPIITVITVALFTFLRNNRTLSVLLSSMMWVLSIYYFIGTTVHAWYISFLILLSVFTPYKYAFVWSLAIGLSYYTYSQPNFKESSTLLALEYSLVFAVLIYEIFAYRNKN